MNKLFSYLLDFELGRSIYAVLVLCFEVFNKCRNIGNITLIDLLPCSCDDTVYHFGLNGKSAFLPTVICFPIPGNELQRLRTPSSYLLAYPLKAMRPRSVFNFGIFACLAYLLLFQLGSYGLVRSDIRNMFATCIVL